MPHQDYIPSRGDVLYSRKDTKSIVEYHTKVQGNLFRFVDVGGQRSERQKWYQCFDCVTAILFFVGSSSFDEVLFEDRTTNRLVESRNIFETIVNNKAFSTVPVILFFNKSDLLSKKVAYRKITDYFSMFPFVGNAHNIEDVKSFLVHMFDSVRQDRSHDLYYHFTTAVDTDNMAFVFQAIRDTILKGYISMI